MVSIIIVNYNTRDLTLKSVESVVNNTKNTEYEVIVIDNASTELGLRESLENQFPQVTFIQNNENLGFGAGNNIALRACHGEYIALLNSDAFLLNDAFSILVKYLSENPHVGIVGPQLQFPDGRVQNSVLYRISVLRIMTDLLGFQKRSMRHENAYWTQIISNNSVLDIPTGLSGACILIRTQCLKDDRIFDPAYYFTIEDADLCNEIKKEGWMVRLVTEARVMHIQNATLRTEFTDQRRIRKEKYWVSLLYYFKKNKSRVEYVFMKGFLVVAFGTLWFIRYSLGMLLRNNSYSMKAMYSKNVLVIGMRG